MPEPSLVDLGVGAAVVLLILKEVFAFVRAMVMKRGNGNGGPAKIEARFKDMEREFLNPIKRMTKELYDWHNVNDSDGVKIWYVRPSLALAIKDLSINIATQTEVLREMLRLQHETIDKLDEE